MTQPTKQDIEENAPKIAEQMPTTMAGLVYALCKLFGMGALFAVACWIVFMKLDSLTNRLITILESNIVAVHANAKAMDALALEIKNNRDGSSVNLSKMGGVVDSILKTLEENRTMLRTNETAIRENSAMLHEIKSSVNLRKQ